MEMITYRVDNDTLSIAVSGRVDTTNAKAVEDRIMGIRMENPGKRTILDADKLEYISSAGLRIILRLRKEDKALSIINVSSEVYEVFDMTGFTEMVDIQKALRQMSVEGCEFIAKGANGAVYRYDEETIIKTYFNADALDEIRQERENARKAFVLGINTAIPYDIVRVGEGYGSVTELLRATSVSKMIRADNENLDQPVKYYVDMLKGIHATQAGSGELPDMKETALDWAQFVAKHLPQDQGQKLVALVEAVPEQTTVLHGDYHTNNVMVQDGDPLLIDMDTLCMGHPVFELGSMFNAFQGFGVADHDIIQQFMGYSYEVAGRFWRKALALYLGTDDEARIASVEDKAKIIGFTRLLRRAVRRPNEAGSAALVACCKEQLADLLARVDTLDF